MKLLGGLVVLVLASAACASDEPDTSDGSTVASPAITQPETTDSSVSTPATSSPGIGTSTPPPSSTGPSAGLTEPSIAFFEIGTFDQPVDVAERPGDIQLFVVEQPGRVLAVTDLSAEVVLDITDLTDAKGEQGLLGLAFHPALDLAYVYFTDLDGDTVVAEFAVDASTGVFDRDSFREVLSGDQPYTNHNGGQLAFGPDQLLYIGLGDGGSGGDPERRAMDLDTRLGKILRIDPVVDGDRPFSVPDDNPFVDESAADPAIWSYGLRNPWRFSFDPETGDLWIADVGQGDFEEINHVRATDRADAGKGVNFGWSAYEGVERFNDDQPADGTVAPVFVYDHSDGRCSVSGGAVVRGSSVADLDGWYLFGDYCSGEIWALDPAATIENPRVVAVGELPGLAAVAVGPEREVYAVSNAGSVMRIIAG